MGVPGRVSVALVVVVMSVLMVVLAESTQEGQQSELRRNAMANSRAGANPQLNSVASKKACKKGVDREMWLLACHKGKKAQVKPCTDSLRKQCSAGQTPVPGKSPKSNKRGGKARGKATKKSRRMPQKQRRRKQRQGQPGGRGKKKPNGKRARGSKKRRGKKSKKKSGKRPKGKRRKRQKGLRPNNPGKRKRKKNNRGQKGKPRSYKVGRGRSKTKFQTSNTLRTGKNAKSQPAPKSVGKFSGKGKLGKGIGGGTASAKAPSTKDKVLGALLSTAKKAKRLATSFGFGKAPSSCKLTSSQEKYLAALKRFENGPAKGLSPTTVAFCMTYRYWPDNIFMSNGKSAWPGLIMDYKGPRPPSLSKCVPAHADATTMRATVTSRSGKKSGVSHTFPAVAVEAGRNMATRKYAVFMATSGGDALQNAGRLIVGEDGKRYWAWTKAEERDNARARRLALGYSRSMKISARLKKEFCRDNM